MLTKRRFFASALLALVLLSAAACAQIDLAPYEIPNSAMAQITLIQPGLLLIRHDSTMNDGTVPTSVILYQNGQPIFSRQFDNDGDWRLFSTFLMSEACYGYVLADHGDPTLGRLFVRLTGNGPSPLLQLMDHRHSVRLMNFGIAFLYETDTACALQLLDWQGRLKVDYALDPALRYSMLGSALLADGTLRALTVDRPRADSGESARMLLRTFSNAGALRSEQAVQSAGLTIPSRLIRTAASSSAPRRLRITKFSRSSAWTCRTTCSIRRCSARPKPSWTFRALSLPRMVRSRCTARRWPTPADCSPSSG